MQIATAFSSKFFMHLTINCQALCIAELLANVPRGTATAF
jgi:hypothetical protein